MRKEEGSILLSVLLFVSFSTFLVISVAAIVRTESYQLRLTQQAYEARSLLTISQYLLEEEWNNAEDITHGEIVFSHGKVEITKENDQFFTLTVSLDSGFEMTESVEISSFLLDNNVEGEESRE